MAPFFGRPVLLGDPIGDVRQDLDLPVVIRRTCTRMTSVVRGDTGEAHRRGRARNEGVQRWTGASVDLRRELRGVSGIAAEYRTRWDAHGSGVWALRSVGTTGCGIFQAHPGSMGCGVERSCGSEGRVGGILPASGTAAEGP